MTADLEPGSFKALLRAGLIAALVGAWCVYALEIPAGAGSASLKAAFAKKAPPPKPGVASVSWINGGAPLDAATLAELQKETEAGAAGPAVQRFIDAARKRGDLDKPVVPGGMSYAQILRRAQELADEANARPRDVGLMPEDRKPGDDDPAVVVPQLLEMLRSSNAEVREEGAMMMIDNRWAKADRAVEAVPALEALVRNGESGAGAAELALKRIRYWDAKRRVPSEPR